jgi:hypothetical protein
MPSLTTAIAGVDGPFDLYRGDDHDEGMFAAEQQQALAIDEDINMDVGSRGPWSIPWWFWQ